MKIQCAAFTCLLLLSCLTPVASSSLQVRGFRSKKALAPLRDSISPEPQPEDKKKTTEHTVTSAFWSPQSVMKLEFSLLFAAVWVLMLGSTPVLVYWWGEKAITKSAVLMSVLMWVSLFGGLFLFTQIILFNSPHFDEVRSLTVIECTYFMTQVITTVGYGDITPAKPRGQVFVGLYVTLSFFVIALLMSEMQIVVMGKVAKYKEQLAEKTAHLTPSLTSSNSISDESSTPLKPPKPSPESLLTSIAIFVGVAAVWATFYANYPGEGKTWGEATYMSLITLTTVGFGAITPVTEGGMIFSAFFMFLGTSALVNVVQNFSTFILEMDQWESWTPDQFTKDLAKFQAKTQCGGHAISELDFMCFAMVQKNMCSQGDIDSIKAAYQAMVGKKGKVSLNSIAQHHGEHVGRLADSDTETNHSSPPATTRPLET